MTDQASQLRQLVLRAARQREADAHPPPRMVAVIAACRSTGVTTIAAQLGKAIVEQGSRAVLIDADPTQSALAQACGVTEGIADYDPAIARHDIHEALRRAPGGVQVVPGVWDTTGSVAIEKQTQLLLRQFQQLGRHADLLVLDLGGSSDPSIQPLVAAADRVLLNTTTEASAVMETYTLIKQMCSERSGKGLELLVSQAANEQEADDVFHRVDRSCRRFLGFGLQYAGQVPWGANVRHGLIDVAARLSNGNVDGPANSAAAKAA